MMTFERTLRCRQWRRRVACPAIAMERLGSRITWEARAMVLSYQYGPVLGREERRRSRRRRARQRRA